MKNSIRLNKQRQQASGVHCTAQMVSPEGNTSQIEWRRHAFIRAYIYLYISLQSLERSRGTVQTPCSQLVRLRQAGTRNSEAKYIIVGRHLPKADLSYPAVCE